MTVLPFANCAQHPRSGSALLVLIAISLPAQRLAHPVQATVKLAHPAVSAPNAEQIDSF